MGTCCAGAEKNTVAVLDEFFPGIGIAAEFFHEALRSPPLSFYECIILLLTAVVS
jgi:hypothetical protein